MPEKNIFSRKKIWILFCLLTALFFSAQSQVLDYSYHLAQHTEALDSDLFYKDLESGTLSKRIGLSALGLLGVLWLMRRSNNKLHINGFMGFTIIFFFLWIFLSIFWSDDFMLTARRSVSFALLWICALGFNRRFTERDIFLFLLFACTAYIALGISVELALGTFPPADMDYRFAGTLHPNHQAWNCVGVIFAGIVLYSTGPRRRPIFLILTIVGLAGLLLTRSRTSVTAFLIALIVYELLVSGKKKIAFYILWTISLLCIVLIVFGPDSVFDSLRDTFFLGREADTGTLTGRTEIWDFGVDYFMERPMTGYGFNAFETVRHITEMERLTSWVATAVHSEYLSLLLGVGIIGTTAYVFILIGGLINTINLFRRSLDKYYAISSAILVFSIAAMLLENLSQNPNIFTFTVFVILTRRGFMKEASLTDRHEEFF